MWKQIAINASALALGNSDNILSFWELGGDQEPNLNWQSHQLSTGHAIEAEAQPLCDLIGGDGNNPAVIHLTSGRVAVIWTDTQFLNRAYKFQILDEAANPRFRLMALDLSSLPIKLRALRKVFLLRRFERWLLCGVR
ncbi:MAG: hypothetical protein IPP40_12045 [bacterium]|nr:hypothetical protein [bacterium]